jgi:hypothetical protein
MADQKGPNPEADKEKAEGDRDTTGHRETGSQAGEDIRNRYDEPEGGDAGITNRPIDEEIANQEALPERGEEKADN